MGALARRPLPRLRSERPSCRADPERFRHQWRNTGHVSRLHALTRGAGTAKLHRKTQQTHREDRRTPQTARQTHLPNRQRPRAERQTHQAGRQTNTLQGNDGETRKVYPVGEEASRDERHAGPEIQETGSTSGAPGRVNTLDGNTPVFLKPCSVRLLCLPPHTLETHRIKGLKGTAF